MANPDMRNMVDHHPHRGDQVEAWIKERRDSVVDRTKWFALDDLLDEYRLAADTGLSLEEVVNGEHEADAQPRARKPKRSR